jgi:hypothetical protein
LYYAGWSELWFAMSMDALGRAYEFEGYATGLHVADCDVEEDSGSL